MPLHCWAFGWYNVLMEEKAFTQDELNSIPKEALIGMFLQMQQMMHMVSQMQKQSEEQCKALQDQVGRLQETIDVLRQQLFGRKTEKASAVMPGQIVFDPVNDELVINEAEQLTEDGLPEEPVMEALVIRRKRPRGKRDIDLSRLKTMDDHHYLSEEQLNEAFPDGWHQLPDETHSDLEYLPARFVAHVHHVGVYAGRDRIIRGDSPYRLIQNSVLTPSLAAAIFNGKYVSALPLYRLEEAFQRDGVCLSRQVMAGWMIRLGREFFRPIHERLHRRLLEARLIHCDETPFIVTEDREKEGRSHSCMWVYHSTEEYGAPAIYLHDYRNGRSFQHPAEMLRDFRGILVTDGHQAYHALENASPAQYRVAGCWAHAKRRFTSLVKALKSDNPNHTTAAEAERRIRAIHHEDNLMLDASPEERLRHRQERVRPLVDDYFSWVRQCLEAPMDRGSELCKALNYSINQERFLRVFLDDPVVPVDNNAAERSIRKFCIGKHNWHICDSKAGAEASGILYSIAESCTANGISPYLYVRHVLEEICRCRALAEKENAPQDKHLDYDELMPWSEEIRRKCRSKKQN